jgi:hypothetical protein
MHTDELLAPKPGSFEVEIPTGQMKRYKLPDINQNSAELIQARGKVSRSKIHKLIKSF